MSDLVPVSITDEAAIFMYRSIRLEFTVSPTSRVLTAVFDNDPKRVHSSADYLHADEIRELLEYFGFNTQSTVTVERRGGTLEFRQELLVVAT